RRQRMERMIEKMCQLGVPVTLEQVLSLAGGAQLGRPHLARALIEQRVCTTVKEAFDRFLANGRPAFVDRDRIAGEKAIEMIRSAGGTATVAHPGVSRVNDLELKMLREAGLAGLEVFHSDHKPAIQEKYLAIARDLDLVPTAGGGLPRGAGDPRRRPRLGPRGRGGVERAGRGWRRRAGSGAWFSRISFAVAISFFCGVPILQKAVVHHRRWNVLDRCR